MKIYVVHPLPLDDNDSIEIFQNAIGDVGPEVKCLSCGHRIAERPFEVYCNMSNHIVIDFDIPDENGNKSFEANLKEASKWPKTYAELSKSGAGIHLHYIYKGDPSKLASIYKDHIEIKVFNGDMALRRKLTKCNDLDISPISSGLPLICVSGLIRKTIAQCLNPDPWGTSVREVMRMANITAPIQVNMPDDWIEQIVNRLRNDPESEWAEIIRCKDCKFFSSTWDGFGFCKKIPRVMMREYDYCSYGERR